MKMTSEFEELVDRVNEIVEKEPQVELHPAIAKLVKDLKWKINYRLEELKEEVVQLSQLIK